MHKFSGELLLITYFSKRRCISILLSFVKALIYMLSSITKKGEIESATNPWVVLVIHNNIQLIELISFQVKYLRKFNDWHDMDQRCGPLKMLRTKIGKSSRLFISILVIQDHIESIEKPILLKGDEVLLNGLLAQSAQ